MPASIRFLICAFGIGCALNGDLWGQQAVGERTEGGLSVGNQSVDRPLTRPAKDKLPKYEVQYDSKASERQQSNQSEPSRSVPSGLGDPSKPMYRSPVDRAMDSQREINEALIRQQREQGKRP